MKAIIRSCRLVKPNLPNDLVEVEVDTDLVTVLTDYVVSHLRTENHLWLRVKEEGGELEFDNPKNHKPNVIQGQIESSIILGRWDGDHYTILMLCIGDSFLLVYYTVSTGLWKFLASNQADYDAISMAIHMLLGK